MRLKFISPCNEVACLPKRSEALNIYIYIYMYTRSKAVRNTFLRYHFPIDRSFNSFRVSTESTDAGGKGKKHIISVSKPMVGSKERSDVSLDGRESLVGK